MNAASKELYQASLFEGSLVGVGFNRETLIAIALSVAVLISAVAVVYAKNYERSLFSHLQNLKYGEQQSQIQYNRLLLEESTLSNLGRVQRIARDKLNMVIPTSRDVEMI